MSLKVVENNEILKSCSSPEPESMYATIAAHGIE
jgi:hypothetical protein